MLSFEDRVVVVTGAGRGLGRAYALELARRGARVVVNDFGGETDGKGADRSAASAVVAEIEAEGGTSVASFDSVATPEGGEAIIRRALDSWGRVDAVISNAGILRDSSFGKLSGRDLDAVLDVHLRGAFFVLQPAFRAMKAAGRGGRIVVTTSASGLFGQFGQTNYAAAKMGLIGLMKTLAIEGARAGIVANAIAPFAATRLTGGADAGLDEELLAPDRVAPIALALAHERCSANGEIFLCGGGWFTRCWVSVARGWVAASGSITPESVLDHFDQIRDGTDALEPRDAMEVGRLFQDRLSS